LRDAPIELPFVRRFAGIEMLSQRILDETTMMVFRDLLDKHTLGGRIFEEVIGHLTERGMAMKQVTMIEASKIAVPSSIILRVEAD
jgi:transposase, IS5 family